MARRTWMLGLVGWWTALTAAGLLAAAADEGWVALFNGENLDGWVQKNGTATYRVEDGCVVGKTSEGSPNSFLCTTRDYGDFELKFEVKVDDELNSGVQFRSQSKADFNNYRVHGPQVEIATNGSAGFVYGEGLKTGWLFGPDQGAAEQKAAFKKGEWNSYHVIARGQRITTYVNGVKVADFDETQTGMTRGFIGLQVHSIKKGTGPYEVRWRNIRIKELN